MKTFLNKMMLFRNFTVLGVLLLSVAMLGCQQDEPDSDYQKSYTLSDLQGQWIWTFVDDSPIPTQRISVDSISADGKSYSMTGLQKNLQQWERVSMTSSVENNVLTNTYEDVSYSYKIVSCSYSTLRVTTNGKSFEAKRVTEKYNMDILGSWECELDDEPYEITFNPDGTYNVALAEKSFSGTYTLYGNLLVRQQNDGDNDNDNNIYRSSFIKFGVSGEGKFYYRTTRIDSTGTLNVRTHYRKQAKCTAEQLMGTWIFNSKNREMLPTNQFEIDVNLADGKTINYYVDGDSLVTEEGSYRVENGGEKVIYTYGSEDFSFSPLYVSRNSMVLGSEDDGMMYSAYRSQEDFRDEIIGTWKSDVYKVDSTEFNQATFTFFENGSVSFSGTVNGELISLDKGVYQLIGNVLVLTTADQKSPLLFVISMDYEKDKGLLLKTVFASEEGVSLNEFYRSKEK